MLSLSCCFHSTQDSAAASSCPQLPGGASCTPASRRGGSRSCAATRKAPMADPCSIPTPRGSWPASFESSRCSCSMVKAESSFKEKHQEPSGSHSQKKHHLLNFPAVRKTGKTAEASPVMRISPEEAALINALGFQPSALIKAGGGTRESEHSRALWGRPGSEAAAPRKAASKDCGRRRKREEEAEVTTISGGCEFSLPSPLPFTTDPVNPLWRENTREHGMGG
ncbi:uncharacterized protein LOC106629549 isoform X1 [Zonotrichia albicollis]|uniref:uncharacterized protein LOC106629549 isoform X1 n=1 Tax=Zonotrichia albicollis TaxID=44394 RepID=UPI003D80FFF2